MNTAHYRNSKKLTRSYAGDVNAGFHPRNTARESIVKHEAGHTISTTISNKFKARGIKISSDEVAERLVRRTLGSKVIQNDMRHRGIRNGREYVKKTVSQYAGKNYQEALAEGVAGYTGISGSKNRSLFSRELNQQIKRMMKGNSRV